MTPTAFDILDKFESIMGPGSAGWESTLRVALALFHGSAGAIFVVRNGRLKPLVSTLSQATRERLKETGFLADLCMDTVSAPEPTTTSFLRLPVTEESKLVGVLYLEGVDKKNPRVLDLMTRCSDTLARSLIAWAAHEREAPHELEGSCGGTGKVYSGIPSGHPEKRAIEDACERALRGLAGSWTIDILPDERLWGWVVGITGPNFYDWLLVSGAHQNARFIQAFIQEVLIERGFRS